jgi:predicted RNA binding protein YcfA (HicA-like mRNA interferase family)
MHIKIILKKVADMPLKPIEMERILLKDGWLLKDQEGSHRHYVHPVKHGKVTIPFHSKELSKIVEKSIRKQAGLD